MQMCAIKGKKHKVVSINIMKWGMNYSNKGVMCMHGDNSCMKSPLRYSL